MADGFVGIDLGTSSVKVLLVDEAGTVLGRGEAEYPIRYPEAGFAEQDPADWWRATVQATRQALADAADRATPVALSLSGQMHGTVLLGEAGEPLAPAIIWPDQRSWREVREIIDRVGAERLIELTGSPIATGFQAATLAWLQRERPRLWADVRRALLPKDYLRLRLTGVVATEPSDASSTLLFDVRARDWSLALLDALALDPAMLPPVAESIAVVGELLPAVASELGLPAGLPVVAGGGDTPCAALGAGIVGPETLLLTLSTGGQLLLPASEVRVDGLGRLHTFCSALAPSPNQAGWYHMAATLAAGLALRWLRDQVFALDGDDAYARMTDWAADVPPGANGLLFLPYLVGERSPHMDPHARGLFLGLTAQHGRPELVRAVMEGVALSCYDAFAALLALARQSGEVPQRIVLAGGGARSPLWRQIVADVFNLPVRPLATTEQSALGAALLAGAGLGVLNPLSATRAWASYGNEVAPRPDGHERYEEMLPLFRDAYLKHKDDFERLASL